MAEHRLTTVDNPFNPFTHFDDWFAWDEAADYHTLSLLARVAKTSDSLSEADQLVAYQDAIEEIAKENVSGVHKLIARSS